VSMVSFLVMGASCLESREAALSHGSLSGSNRNAQLRRCAARGWIARSTERVMVNLMRLFVRLLNVLVRPD
jgi:hypothetical protein